MIRKKVKRFDLSKLMLGIKSINLKKFRDKNIVSPIKILHRIIVYGGISFGNQT